MQSSTSKKTAIGKRVAMLRRKQGFSTPQALAEATGNPAITKNVIVNIEQGRKSDLTLTEAMHIAKALHVPLPMLVVDVDHPFDNSDVKGFEEYTNADILDLFSFARTRYGMIRQEDTENRLASLHFFDELPSVKGYDHLRNIYEALNLLSTGIHDYSTYARNAIAAERRGNSIEVYQNVVLVEDAKANIYYGLSELKRLNIDVPPEIEKVAQNCLRSEPITDPSSIDFDEVLSSTKGSFRQNLFDKILKTTLETEETPEANNVQGMD